MQAIWTILLLVISNVFMTFAWYGQLKLPELVPTAKDWPLVAIIFLSWGVALLEYFFMIPANRIGSNVNGGPFNLMQLKVIQEVISLTVFTVIVSLVFKNQPIQWNHIAAFGCLVLAVFFVFLK